MRAEAVAAALLFLAGCAGERGPATPDPEVVAALAEVVLAESAAAITRRDADSARVAALAAHGADAGDLHRWLDAAAERPADGDALWDAVAQRIEGERLSGPR